MLLQTEFLSRGIRKIALYRRSKTDMRKFKDIEPKIQLTRTGGKKRIFFKEVKKNE